MKKLLFYFVLCLSFAGHKIFAENLNLAEVGVVTFGATNTQPATQNLQKNLKQISLDVLQQNFNYLKINANIDSAKNRVLLASQSVGEKNIDKIVKDEKVHFAVYGFITSKENQIQVTAFIFNVATNDKRSFTVSLANAQNTGDYAQGLQTLIEEMYRHSAKNNGRPDITIDVPSQKNTHDKSKTNDDDDHDDNNEKESSSNFFSKLNTPRNDSIPIYVFAGLLSGKHEHTFHSDDSNSEGAALAKGASFLIGAAAPLIHHFIFSAQYNHYTMGDLQYYSSGTYAAVYNKLKGSGKFTNFDLKGRYFFGNEALRPSAYFSLVRYGFTYTTNQITVDEILVPSTNLPLSETWSGWGWRLGSDYHFSLPPIDTPYATFHLSFFAGFHFSNLFDWDYNSDKGSSRIIISASSISLNYNLGAAIHFPAYQVSFSVEYLTDGVTFMETINQAESGFSVKPKFIAFTLSKILYF